MVGKNCTKFWENLGKNPLYPQKYACSYTQWRQYCRKLEACRCTATLPKASRITESHSGIPRFEQVYASMFIWN